MSDDNKYVYINSERGLWTVGFYDGKKWFPESDHAIEDAAAERVHFLNGSHTRVEKASGKMLAALKAVLDAAGIMPDDNFGDASDDTPVYDRDGSWFTVGVLRQVRAAIADAEGKK